MDKTCNLTKSTTSKESASAMSDQAGKRFLGIRYGGAEQMVVLLQEHRHSLNIHCVEFVKAHRYLVFRANRGVGQTPLTSVSHLMSWQEFAMAATQPRSGRATIAIVVFPCRPKLPHLYLKGAVTITAASSHSSLIIGIRRRNPRGL